MENISRRGFVGAAAAAAAGMGMAGLGASFAEAEPQEVAPKIEAGTEDLDMYRMHTSLDTINELRREAIDKCEDYVCEDGTVIPGLYAAGDVCGSIEEKDGKQYGMGFDAAMNYGYIMAETVAGEIA